MGATTAELDWLTLEADEEVVWTGKPHEYSLVPALVVGVPLSIVLVGVAIIASAYLRRENTNYVITTRALYKKTGVFSRDIQRVSFEKVQNTSYAQDFFGRQFGYGDVDVSTAGSGGVELRFRSVPDPGSVQERINRRLGATDEDRERGDAAAVLDDILEELRAIRAALDAEPGAGTERGARGADARPDAGDGAGRGEEP